MIKYEIKDKDLFLESLYQLHQSIGWVPCTPYESLQVAWDGDAAMRDTILLKERLVEAPLHLLITREGLWEEIVAYMKPKLDAQLCQKK